MKKALVFLGDIMVIKDSVAMEREDGPNPWPSRFSKCFSRFPNVMHLFWAKVEPAKHVLALGTLTIPAMQRSYGTISSGMLTFGCVRRRLASGKQTKSSPDKTINNWGRTTPTIATKLASWGKHLIPSTIYQEARKTSMHHCTEASNKVKVLICFKVGSWAVRQGWPLAVLHRNGRSTSVGSSWWLDGSTAFVSSLVDFFRWAMPLKHIFFVLSSLRFSSMFQLEMVNFSKRVFCFAWRSQISGLLWKLRGLGKEMTLSQDEMNNANTTRRFFFFFF